MLLNILKEFTRGGQMTMHAWRMICQASRAVVWFSLILSLIAYFVLFLSFSRSYDRYLVKEYLFHDFIVGFNKDHYHESISIKSPKGRIGKMKASTLIKGQRSAYAVRRVKLAAWRALYTTLIISVLIVVVVVLFFIRRSKKLSHKKPLRGALLVSPMELKKMVQAQKKASDLALANVPLIQGSETQHILLTGTTGTGKSVALTELMDQVRGEKKKAIVYDCDGGFISTYYNSETDLILNPLDQRAPCWNIWQECSDQADYEAFAESLMPMSIYSSDPFWIKSSRLILSSAAYSMRKKDPTTQKLLRLLLTESLEGIKEQLKNTVAETLVSDKIEKTALSVKATLSTYCKALAYLPDESNSQDIFSIRQWIRDEKQTGWLFIATNKEKISAMRPLISAWLDLAVRSILSLDRDLERRVWFFMDELPSLHELPSLKEVLSEGRKYGACFAATIQDIHQLRNIYNREQAEALLACFNTKVCFRTESTDSALWAERAMGSQEVIEMREGFSYGANTVRDGVTLNQERRKTSVVMDTEFSKLNDLEAYLKLSGDFPITKLKFKCQAREDVAKPLEEREISELLMTNEPSKNEGIKKNPSDDTESLIDEEKEIEEEWNGQLEKY